MEKIQLKDLTFTYPLSDEPAIKNINLSVTDSEFIVICGKSGCGKSTLLRQMKKPLIPHGIKTGSILWNGENIDDIDLRDDAQRIGFVQQNPDNQLVTDKVWHELAFGLENLGLSNSVIKRRVSEMSSYFGIQRWFRKSVSDLSGGQKQLLNLASVMVMQPDVLILDEPTSQLDPIAASEFLNTLYKINRDLGTTVIISEHRLEKLFPLADRVVVMDKGEIISDKPPRETGTALEYWNGAPHPMYYGLPQVMRLFPENLAIRNDYNVAWKSPLTIREGRLLAEQLLDGKLLLNDSFCGPNYELNSSKCIPIIEAKDLWFRYQRDGDDVLRGLSFSIESPMIYCLLGGNGAGKSTLLKALCNIIEPQRGHIKINGDILGKASQSEILGRELAMVPQNPQSLFTEITVEEEIVEPILRSDMEPDAMVSQAEEMMELMEISHLRKSNPYDLSGGEQQRLALGKVLMLKPKILLLDEPTKGLDPFFKLSLGKIMRKLVEAGTTILMVSHDIEFCASYGDKCGMFFDGEISSSGTREEFFRGNSFYTTTANKILRKWNYNIVTCEEGRAWLEMFLA